MNFEVITVDYAPEDMYAQVPFRMKLLREVAGPDRPDYWLAKLEKPILWAAEGANLSIFHIVVSARYVGVRIVPDTRSVTVGIAYVVDETLVSDELLDFRKCRYVAIGEARRTSDPQRYESTNDSRA